MRYRSTWLHIQTQLARHAITVAPTLDSIGAFLYASAPHYTRMEHAMMCGVCLMTIDAILYDYADTLPPRTKRAKRYAWPPHGERTLTEWVIWTGNARLTRECVWWRLQAGWCLEDALLTPVRRVKRRTHSGRRMRRGNKKRAQATA